MSVLQDQVVQKVSGLSEDNLQFLLELINRFMQPEVKGNKNMVNNEESADDACVKRHLTSIPIESAGEMVITKRIGIARGQNLYDDDYDFDEMNTEIAKMFGVVE